LRTLATASRDRSSLPSLAFAGRRTTHQPRLYVGHQRGCLRLGCYGALPEWQTPAHLFVSPRWRPATTSYLKTSIRNSWGSITPLFRSVPRSLDVWRYHQRCISPTHSVTVHPGRQSLLSVST